MGGNFQENINDDNRILANNRDHTIYGANDRPITSAFTRIDQRHPTRMPGGYTVYNNNPNIGVVVVDGNTVTHQQRFQQRQVVPSQYEQFEFYGSSNSISSTNFSPSETKV